VECILPVLAVDLITHCEQNPTMGDDRLPGNAAARPQRFVCPVVNCPESQRAIRPPKCRRHPSRTMVPARRAEEPPR
jgi:hypothetical protein